MLVGVIKSFGDIGRHLQRLRQRQRRMLLNFFFQRPAGNVFHNNIVSILVTSHIIHVDNIRMGQFSRRLRFPTDDPTLDVVRVRSFDVATFVAFGGAQLGICGADVLMEFDYPEIYAPLDLGIGRCRVSVAEPVAAEPDDPSRWSRVTVATKYPNIARRHFAARGVQAEIVHLNGAMELAPSMGLAKLIVDLVQTGSTLKANGLQETETIASVTSRLVVNRTALKTRPEAIGAWIARFRAALAERDAR